MNNPDFLKLENSLCYQLYVCSKEISRHYTKILKELDLTYTQYIVMMYFWEKKTCNLITLANTLLLDSSTLTPLLKKLEQKGYVKREKSKKDERNLIITLTPKGEKIKSMAVSKSNFMKEYININEEEIVYLSNILFKILNNVRKGDE